MRLFVATMGKTEICKLLGWTPSRIMPSHFAFGGTKLENGGNYLGTSSGDSGGFGFGFVTGWLMRCAFSSA
jgi:hypothetical protein